jgi:hypothetical protein
VGGVRLVALADASGQDSGFQGVMRDVTRRKEIEEQLLEALLGRRRHDHTDRLIAGLA